MRTVLTSVILSGLVAYGVSSKIARESQEDIVTRVNSESEDWNFAAVQIRYMRDQCYDLEARIKDLEQETIIISHESSQNTKDVDVIIEMLRRAKERQK